MDSLTLLIIMLLFLSLSAYFSGSEAALFSIPTIRLKAYQTEIDPRKQLISKLLLHPRDLLVTVFALNTLVNVLLQNSAANLFGDASSWILKVGVPLVLTLVFGEILPKYTALQNNLKFSYLVAPSIDFFMRILKPFVDCAVAMTIPLSRLMFFFLKREADLSSEEIRHILKTSKECGIFNADEGELIKGYLEFQQASVKELMRPREDIIFYNIRDPLSKLLYRFTDQKLSRMPVCDPDLENLLGIISVKQFFIHHNQFSDPRDLIPHLMKPFYVPESMPAALLLRRFHEQRQQMALVVDEYGSISGLITHEDLIETVVGEIADLHDQPNLYTRSGKHEIIASGKLELTEFNDLFDAALESPSNKVTIGGWLTERLDEIPKSGTQYELEGFLFRILAATPSRVRRIYVRKL